VANWVSGSWAGDVDVDLFGRVHLEAGAEVHVRFVSVVVTLVVVFVVVDVGG